MKNSQNKKLGYIVVLVVAFFMSSCVTPSAKDGKIDVFTKDGFIEQLGVSLSNNDFDIALKSFDTVPIEYADDTDLKYLHASLLLSMGNVEPAEVITDELIAEDPENIEFLNLAMFVAKQQGDTIKKQDLLVQVLQKEVNNPTANNEQGNSQMLLKKYDLARRYFLRSLKVEPQNEEGLLGFGQACYFLDDLDVAKKTFQQLVDFNPENAMGWAGLGKLYGESKNYGEAIDCAKKAVALDPDYYYHWIDLGNYYRHKGKYDDAIDALNRAVKIDPTYFLAYVYRAGLNDQQENRKEALEDYKKLVAYKPDYYYAYEAMGVLAWGEKDWDNVRLGFYNAYEQKPTNASYALMVAASYLKQGKTAESKKFLSKVLKNLDSSSVEYWVVRMYWENLGDEAVQLKVSKLTSVTKRGKYYYYLGLWYELQGHDVLAKKCYIQVTEMEAPMFYEYRLAEWAIEKKISKKDRQCHKLKNG